MLLYCTVLYCTVLQVSSDWGGQIDCREAGDLLMVEGQCHSGKGHDCSGSANIVDCCPGQ